MDLFEWAEQATMEARQSWTTEPVRIYNPEDPGRVLNIKAQFSAHQVQGVDSEPVVYSAQMGDFIIQISDWTFDHDPVSGMVVERPNGQRWELQNRPERAFRDHGDHHKEWRLFAVYEEEVT